MSTPLNFAVFSLSMAAASAFLFLLSRLMGKRFSSRCRYIMWVILIVRMCLPLTFLPTFVTVDPSALPYTAEVAAEPRTVTPAEPSPPGAIEPASEPVGTQYEFPGGETSAVNKTSFVLPRLEVVISVAYAAAAVLIFGVRIAGYNVTMKKIRRSIREPDEKTAALYRLVVESENIRRAPALYVSGRIRSPLLCGFFKRAVIITEESVFSPELEDVLRHELIHHKRGDLYVKLLGLIATSLHFLNPASYFAVSMANREMEFSCDERVLSGCDEERRSEYVEAVLDLVLAARFRGTGSSLTTEFMHNKRHIKNRFRLIMDDGKKKRGAAVVAVALLVCVLAGSVVSFRAAPPDFTNPELPAAVEIHPFEDGNVAVVNVRNLTGADCSVEVKGTYKNAGGETLGTETKKFSGLSEGDDNRFIFNPGFAFAGFDCETVKVDDGAKAYSKYVDFYETATAKVLMNNFIERGFSVPNERTVDLLSVPVVVVRYKSVKLLLSVDADILVFDNTGKPFKEIPMHCTLSQSGEVVVMMDIDCEKDGDLFILPEKLTGEFRIVVAPSDITNWY